MNKHWFCRIGVLSALAVLAVSGIVFHQSISAAKTGYAGSGLRLSNLSVSTGQARKLIKKFSWGSGPDQLGFDQSPEGWREGPWSFDVDSAGRIAVADQVNSRIQVYDKSGELQHSVKVPRTTLSVRFSSLGILVTEPWNDRRVLEYDLTGTLLGQADIPESVIWPTDIYEVNDTVYVESNNCLVAISLAHRPAVSEANSKLPGRPLRYQPGAYGTFGGYEDGRRAVRFVEQGAETKQLKLSIEDRGILGIQDHFTDERGNLYVQAYLSNASDHSEDPQLNPEALIRINAGGEFEGAFVKSSLHYTDQYRQFAVSATGKVYQLETGPDGVTLYRIKLRRTKQDAYVTSAPQDFPDLPQGMYPEPPTPDRVMQLEAANTKGDSLYSAVSPEASEIALNTPSGSYNGYSPMTQLQILDLAFSAVGSWYRFGGESWNPFDRESSLHRADCSGLVSTVWQVFRTRATTEEDPAGGRPATTGLRSPAATSPWFSVTDRQIADACVHVSAEHAFLYGGDAGSGNVYAYEALNAGYRIRFWQRPVSGFAFRRRKDINSVGLVGRDKTWIYGPFIDKFIALGGQNNVGRPFNNGGSHLVHRWGPSGYTQDFKNGQFGQCAIMWGDAVGRAHLVRGSIYWTYVNMSGPTSFLGWPTSDEFLASGSPGCSGAVPRQNFQGGYITLNCSSQQYQAFRY
jgi:hypothetical protein